MSVLNLWMKCSIVLSLKRTSATGLASRSLQWMQLGKATEVLQSYYHNQSRMLRNVQVWNFFDLSRLNHPQPCNIILNIVMFVHVVLALLIFSGTSSSDTPVTIFPSLQITGISIQPSSVSLMQGSFSGKFYRHLASITRFLLHQAHGLLLHWYWCSNALHLSSLGYT